MTYPREEKEEGVFMGFHSVDGKLYQIMLVEKKNPSQDNSRGAVEHGGSTSEKPDTSFLDSWFEWYEKLITTGYTEGQQKEEG